MQRDLSAIGLGKRTLVMGVINVTPDSFSDGGECFEAEAAIARGLAMLDEGADIVDIGGESTRPATFHDQKSLTPDEEISRVLPVVQGIMAERPEAWVSIDTYKAPVAEEALKAGAAVVNDISGLGADTKMPALIARTQAHVVIMHMPGRPHHMPDKPFYGPDLVGHMRTYFDTRLEIALAAGITRSRIILDPGIGFGKNTAQNAEIIRRVAELKQIGYPVMVAPSRKRFIGELMGGAEPGERLPGTAAAIALSIAGGADIIRIHDIAFIAQLAKVCDGILKTA